MKKGFTLLELIVVIVIVGILATLGMQSYTQVIEKGRSAEAKSNLAVLRKLQIAHYQDAGSYGTLSALIGDGLPYGVPIGYSCSNPDYYFKYYCYATGTSAGMCRAHRCTSGGKEPQATTGYYITLSTVGDWGGTPP